MGKILRRTFLIGAAAIAGGVAFGAYQLNKTYPNPLEDDLAEGESTFNPFLKISKDNDITVMISRAEMGQGISTTLAALVAEELDVDVASIKTEMAPAAYAYYNSAMLADGAPVAHYDRGTFASLMRVSMGSVGKILGLQATGGSSSVNDLFDRMREAGCTARETLKAVAAERFNQPVDQLKTEGGAIVLTDGTKVPYGDLAEAAANMSPPSDMKLRDASDWKQLGKSQPRVDMVKKSTGAPIFGVDVDIPDMVYATIRMNPRIGGKMISFDATAAKQVRDVIDVIDITGPEEEAFGGGFAVIANNTWAAFQGADAVGVKWGEAPYPANTEAIMAVIDKALKEGDGDNLRSDGDVDLVFADADREKIVEAQYQVPYLAHATMEPMNATAQFKGGRLDVWTGTQAPTLIRDDCAHEVGIDAEQTFIHTTYLGGGFGRRGEVDFARFAARVAKSTDGKPVKVTWTREEDMTHDTYRPASMSRWRAVLDDNGLPRAIDGRIATPSVIGSLMKRTFPSISPAGPDNTITHGAFDQPYSVANYRVSGIKAPVDIPVGFWRSVGNSYNSFYHESFMDEIATKTGMDPIELRRKLMVDHPTALGVVNKVAEMSNWSAPAAPNTAKGFAFTLSFGCWVAQVVEIEQTDDGIKINKVWCAADIGQAIDPRIVRAQLQSGIVFGLSSAMMEEITFDDGMVQETNYDSFDAMRMNQCPEMDIVVMEEDAHRGGAGEPGTPPAVAALANAVHKLTGKRIRTLPLANEVEFV
ncbi:MAG: molybdopterin cofactor-binding domain-containing protein, partial [Pseudomonadota bacterium]